MNEIFNAGTSNAIVAQDVRTDTLEALADSIDALRAALDSGELSGVDRANAVATLGQLQASYHEVSGFTATVDEVARATDAIGRADTIVETAGDDLFGEELSTGDRYLDIRPGMWDAAGGAGGIDGMVSDGAALRELFESDPQAFAAQWSEMSAEDRQLAMFSLQQEVAMDNQITQMLTSLMKASHDTAMAVARNLQV